MLKQHYVIASYVSMYAEKNIKHSIVAVVHYVCVCVRVCVCEVKSEILFLECNYVVRAM